MLRPVAPFLLTFLLATPSPAQSVNPPSAPASSEVKPSPAAVTAPAPPPTPVAPSAQAAPEEPRPDAPPPPEPEPPPSPSDPVPAVIPPTAPAQAPPRLVRKEYETPPRDEAADGRDPRPLRVFDFAVELDLGANQRFGGASSFESQERLGVAYGASFWLALDELVALGLELEHVGLGSARDENGANVLNAEWAATSAALSGRFVPWKSADWEPFVALRVGLALQHVEADGVRPQASPFESPRVFSCEETDGPGLALGGGVGAALGLGERLRLLGRLDADGHRLTSEAVGGCAVGVGASTSVSLGIGLVYGFDASNRAR